MSVQIEALTKSYGVQPPVLDKLSLDVPTGQIHAVLGPSGSGKSTLLRCLLGLIPFDSGEISIEGRKQSEVSQREWVQGLGYIPQNGGLFPHLRARENLSLQAGLMGWSEDKIKQRLGELLPLADLEASLIEKYPWQLSGGQRQRVALLRAAFMNPSVLIMDEPLGALDPLIRYDLQEELHKIFRRLNKTVLLVTHDITEAAFLADQVSMIHEGTIVQTGSFEELLTKPASPFVRRFIQAQRVLPQIAEEAPS